jgi:hypothetical protein
MEYKNSRTRKEFWYFVSYYALVGYKISEHFSFTLFYILL